MNSKKTSNKSLRFRLMSLSLGITLLLGASSFGILKYIGNKSTESALNSFASYSVALSDAIAAQYFERYGDVQAFSINPTILSSDRKTIVNLLNTYAAMYGIYDLILVTDKSGRLVAVNDKDPSGNAIKTQDLYSKNYSEFPWHKAVMEGKFTEDKQRGFAGTFAEDVLVDPLTTEVFGTKRLGSGFSTSIKNSKGEVIGVISNRAGSRWFEVAFRETFESLKASGYPHSQLYLFSKDTTLAFAFDPSALTKEGGISYNWDELFKKKVADFSPTLANSDLKKDQGLIDYEGNEENATGFSPLNGTKFVEEMGWSVLIHDDANEVLAVARNSQKIFYFVFSAVVLIAGFVASFVSASISGKLYEILNRLNFGSTEVTKAATDISRSSTELSEDATEQAAAIQETAASIDEVSAMVKKSAENASESQIASNSSREAANEGKEAIREMLGSIEAISESNRKIMTQVEDGNQKIAEIVKVIAEIGNKTKVINDIVFQTKLLSFNASVEAARAGEHGKGFAVVAEEVGNLAQMSGNAAKEISSMLSESIEKVESIVNQTKSQVGSLIVEGRNKVEVGTEVAKKCDTMLMRILASVEEVDNLVAGITTASNEQAQGVSEINKAINLLDQTTQKNSGVANRTASSSANLKGEAVKLSEIVSELNLLVSGKQVAKFTTNAGAEEDEVKPKAQRRSPNKTNLANVISLPKKKKSLSVDEASPPQREKKVVGGSNTIPSKDDPRFEDA